MPGNWMPVNMTKDELIAAGFDLNESQLREVLNRDKLRSMKEEHERRRVLRESGILSMESEEQEET